MAWSKDGRRETKQETIAEAWNRAAAEEKDRWTGSDHFGSRIDRF